MASLDAIQQKVAGAELQHAQLLWATGEPIRAFLQLQQVSSRLGAGVLLVVPAHRSSSHVAPACTPELWLPISLLQMVCWCGLKGAPLVQGVTGLLEGCIVMPNPPRGGAQSQAAGPAARASSHTPI